MMLTKYFLKKWPSGLAGVRFSCIVYTIIANGLYTEELVMKAVLLLQNEQK